ncbi:hypothetical protein OWV82_011096 [Melia azedarach]|uniref:Uncharacterized protein n=1 Tax=Melia azedarach TaxID=155640 RepID=A0ACC1XX81_MELAZ|nr:hypothetical protein OWV82_011096 [Melia azedarach]
MNWLSFHPNRLDPPLRGNAVLILLFICPRSSNVAFLANSIKFHGNCSHFIASFPQCVHLGSYFTVEALKKKLSNFFILF